jgi:hypothetical protein
VSVVEVLVARGRPTPRPVKVTPRRAGPGAEPRARQQLIKDSLTPGSSRSASDAPETRDPCSARRLQAEDVTCVDACGCRGPPGQGRPAALQ